jgi:hypothetical protein
LTVCGAGVSRLIRFPQAGAVALSFVPVITFLTLIVFADHEAQKTCSGRWKTQTLGAHWTLLRCPIGNATKCAIEIDGSDRLYGSGSRLILQATNVRTIDFSSENCVENVVVRDDRTPGPTREQLNTPLWPQPVPEFTVTSRVPDKIALTVSNPAADEAFQAIASSLESIGKKLDRAIAKIPTDINIRITPDMETISALSQIASEFRTWANANQRSTTASHQRSLLNDLIMNRCVAGIRAAGLKNRIGAFFRADQACRDALLLQLNDTNERLAEIAKCPVPCAVEKRAPLLSLISACEGVPCTR